MTDTNHDFFLKQLKVAADNDRPDIAVTARFDITDIHRKLVEFYCAEMARPKARTADVLVGIATGICTTFSFVYNQSISDKTDDANAETGIRMMAELIEETLVVALKSGREGARKRSKSG